MERGPIVVVPGVDKRLIFLEELADGSGVVLVSVPEYQRRPAHSRLLLLLVGWGRGASLTGRRGIARRGITRTHVLKRIGSFSCSDGGLLVRFFWVRVSLHAFQIIYLFFYYLFPFSGFGECVWKWNGSIMSLKLHPFSGFSQLFQQNFFYFPTSFLSLFIYSFIILIFTMVYSLFQSETHMYIEW